MRIKNLLTLKDLREREIQKLISASISIKRSPKRFAKKLYENTLLMFFEVPSLRTRVSFEVAMAQLGGQAINYYATHSPWGAGKESIEDVAKVLSKYCNAIMARIYSHEQLENLAENSTIPVINGMTNFSHPCQVLGDLMTIQEKKKKLKGLTLAYFGDANNNTTNSLLYGCAKTGINIKVCCPKQAEFAVQPQVLREAKRFAYSHGSEVKVSNKVNIKEKAADIIYTDSWMSYRILPKEKKRRTRILKPYQVNKKILKQNPKAIFMHCLPALRGQEVTQDVIDGKQSVVFQQAENRLHSEKAILLWLLKKL